MIATDGTYGIRVWKVVNKRLEKLRLSGQGSSVLGIAFNTDGTRLVSAGWDHTVRQWDMQGGHNSSATQPLQWDYVIDPHILVEDPGSDQSSQQALVHSRYLERGPITWPYRLSNPEVIQQYMTKPSTIYVYAEGQFGSSGSDLQKPFRRNIGPEVFLPGQPLLYVGLLMIQAGITLKNANFPRSHREGRTQFSEEHVWLNSISRTRMRMHHSPSL